MTLLKHQRIIVHGMTTSRNFGDVLLCETTVAWLRELGCGEILSARASPEVQKILGTRNAALSDYRRADAVLLTGGGYFQMTDHGKAAIKSFAKYAGPLMLGRIFGKPLAVLAVGLAPLPHGILARGTKWLFDSCKVVSLRDPRSVEYAGALNLRKPPLLAGDLVFAHRRETLPDGLADEARALLDKQPQERLIGLHLSQASAGSTDYTRLYALIEEVLAPMQGTRFVLLEDHPSGSGKGPQLQAHDELRARLGADRCIAVPYRDTAFMMAILAGLDAVFTNKLHVGLAAAAMGTTPFSLAKNVKNIGSFADLGLAENCAMLGAPDAQVRAILERLRDCQDRFEVPAEIRDRSLSNREILARFLAGDP